MDELGAAEDDEASTDTAGVSKCPQINRLCASSCSVTGKVFCMKAGVFLIMDE